jgi:hypothetical protein
MADDLNNRGEPDRSLINLNEAYELDYWLGSLGVSEKRLRRAIAEVGSSAAAVRRHLAQQP